jgi:hypothetical protein
MRCHAAAAAAAAAAASLLIAASLVAAAADSGDYGSNLLAVRQLLMARHCSS